MKNNFPNKQKGFTIIETLVAIFVLLIATTGPLTFSQNGLRASFLARDQVVAFYLAQDVIETIKHLRDNQALEGGDDWLGKLSECKPSSDGSVRKCTIDTANEISVSLKSCTGECDPLYYDETAKKYTHFSTGNKVSKYTRNVYVAEIVDDVEAQIVVEITWNSNSFSNRRVVVQENIYNWVPSFTDPNP